MRSKPIDEIKGERWWKKTGHCRGEGRKRWRQLTFRPSLRATSVFARRNPYDDGLRVTWTGSTSRSRLGPSWFMVWLFGWRDPRHFAQDPCEARQRERESSGGTHNKVSLRSTTPRILVRNLVSTTTRLYIYIYTYSVYSIIVATLILRENENMRSVIGLFMETKEGRVLSHSLSRGRFLSWRKAAKRARRICKEFGRVGKFPSPSPYFLNAKLCFIVRYLLARERWGNNLDPRNQKLPFPEFSASTFRPN